MYVHKIYVNIRTIGPTGPSGPCVPLIPGKPCIPISPGGPYYIICNTTKIRNSIKKKFKGENFREINTWGIEVFH